MGSSDVVAHRSFALSLKDVDLHDMFNLMRQTVTLGCLAEFSTFQSCQGFSQSCIEVPCLRHCSAIQKLGTIPSKVFANRCTPDVLAF